MPRVPTLERRVTSTPLPNVRRTATETYASAGGPVAEGQGQLARAEAGLGNAIGGVGEVGQRVGQAQLQLVHQIEREEQDRADQVELLSADRQLGELEDTLLRDPNLGALTVRGKDVAGLHQRVLEQYDQKAGDLATTMRNDRQRIAFQRVLNQRRAGVVDVVDRHTLQELDTYERTETEAYLKQSVQAAIASAGDPLRIAEELDRQEAVVTQHGKRMGLGDEARKALIGELRSNTHAGVIERLLARDRDRDASDYYFEVKDQVAGDKRASIEKALDEGSRRGQAQRQADEIIDAGGTLSEQRARVRTISDPKLRDAVMDRVEHEAAVREKAERDDLEQRSIAAYNVVDKYHTVTRVPPSDWVKLPGPVRSSLRGYAEALAKEGRVDTDWVTYYGLYSRAGNDASGFARENLLAYRGKLGDEQFKELVGLQLRMRNGERAEADKMVAEFRTKDQIVNDTLTLAGIDVKATDWRGSSVGAQREARFRRLLDDRVNDLQALTGKRASNRDIQEIADDLLRSIVLQPGGGWSSILPGGMPVDDVTKRVMDLTVDDVPPADRANISRLLREAGQPVTPDNILKFYVARKRRLGEIR